MNFVRTLSRLHHSMKDYSRPVHTERWQGIDISKKPEAAMRELRHVFIRADMEGESLNTYRLDIEPNLPWVDDHFEERVCGQPINPGVEWMNWPWGHSAVNFLDKDGKFNHNYMERYWPKRAGAIGATKTADEYKMRWNAFYDSDTTHGIYHPFGDLADVVKQLAREPMTRQAMLPVFFPEDTGAVHQGRVPCSIAYQFFMREGRLDVSYWLRSCDYRRHMRDDIYLTVRLLLWVLQEVRKLNPVFNDVVPGEYIMMITSLHCFVNDYREMFS